TAVAGRGPAQIGKERDQLAGRRRFGEARALRDVTDPVAVAPAAVDHRAVDCDPARVGMDETHHALEQRALAGGVGTDHVGDLAWPNGKADAVERGQRAEALSKVADFDHAGFSISGWASTRAFGVSAGIARSARSSSSANGLRRSTMAAG